MNDTTKKVALATVEHKPGALRLDLYPLLVYAPKQWGEGVRVASNGARATEIAETLAAAGPAEAVARHFGVTLEELGQAARYVAQNP